MLDFVRKIIDQNVLIFDRNADRGNLSFNLFTYAGNAMLSNPSIFKMGGKITHVFIEDEEDVTSALECSCSDIKVFVDKDLRKDFNYLKGSLHPGDDKLIVFVTQYGDAIAGSY